MSASAVSICNLALTHLGSDKAIVTLTERSTEARPCNQWYEQCRDEVLRDFAWPFATVIEDLALVATEPTDEWGYSYTYPIDALRLVRAPYGSTRNATPATTVKYRIVRAAAGGRLLYTDQDTGTVEYIFKVTDPAEFPPDFIAALSYLIASRICPQVIDEKRKENTVLMLQMYEKAIGKAKANALNEQSPDVEPDSGFISARA